MCFRDGILPNARGCSRVVVLPTEQPPPHLITRTPMKRLTFLAVVLSIVSAHAAEPLRVFIRGGKKTHGPEQHEHQRFLEKWKPLLTERGMQVDGALEFPSAEQLAKADVLVMYAQDGGNITMEQRPVL